MTTLFKSTQKNTAAAAIASLARIARLRDDSSRLHAAMTKIHKASEKDGRNELTASEQREFDAMTSQRHAINADIDRELAAHGVLVNDGARIVVMENSDADPAGGFESFGHFANAVAYAPRQQRAGAQIDPRLRPLQAAAPGTASNEGSGSDGGILVPPGFSRQLFMLSLDEDSLLPMTDEMPLTGNSMLIPKDETTPWGTNGIRAYWAGENTVATPTKPVLSGMDLRLKKLIGLTPVTGELVDDAIALASYLPTKMGSSIRWKANDAILYGSGAGIPLGAMNSPSVVTVAKDTGQATNTLSATNLANMASRLPPGSLKRSVWLINNNVLPALLTLTLGNYPVFLPIANPDRGLLQFDPVGKIFGRPVVISQHAKSFSAQGDVLLLDLAYYQSITKAAGIETATSMHLYFDADAMAFRTTFRLDGQPKLSAPISPANGSTTMSPFVQLGAR